MESLHYDELSGAEGIFPDLESFAENRLTEVCPNSKVLRKTKKIGETKHLEDGKEITEDIQNWSESLDSSISEECLNSYEIPPIRESSECKVTSTNQVKVKKVNPVPRSFQDWDKIDLDAEMDKVDDIKVQPKKSTTIKEFTNKQLSSVSDRDKVTRSHEERLKGNEAFRSNDYAEALTYYNRAIQLNRAEVSLHNNRAQTYIKLKKYTEALQDCNHVITSEPHNIKALCRRAVSYKFLANYKKSKLDIDHILNLDPVNKNALDLCKDVDKALADIKVAGHRMTIEEISSSDDEEDRPEPATTTGATIVELDTDEEEDEGPLVSATTQRKVIEGSDSDESFVMVGKTTTTTTAGERSTDSASSSTSSSTSTSTSSSTSKSITISTSTSTTTTTSTSTPTSTSTSTTTTTSTSTPTATSTSTTTTTPDSTSTSSSTSTTTPDSTSTSSSTSSSTSTTTITSNTECNAVTPPPQQSPAAPIVEQLPPLKTMPNYDNKRITHLKTRGNDYFKCGDYANALHQYDAALLIADQYGGNLCATLYSNRAAAHHKCGDSLSSVRDCDLALQQAPHLSRSLAGKTLLRRAVAMETLERYAAAYQDFHLVATRFDTQSTLARQGTDRCMQVLRDVKGSSWRQHLQNIDYSHLLVSTHETDAKDRIAVDKDYNDIKEKGNACVKKGMYTEAVTYYSVCIEDGENLVACLCNRALCNLKLKNFELCVLDITSMLEVEPEHIKGLFRRASAYMNLSKFKLAEKDLIQLLILEPRNNPALVLLESCEIKLEQQIQTARDTILIMDEEISVVAEPTARPAVNDTIEQMMEQMSPRVSVTAPPASKTRPPKEENTEYAVKRSQRCRPSDDDDAPVVEGGVSTSRLTSFEFLKTWSAIRRDDVAAFVAVLVKISPGSLRKVVTNKLDGLMLKNLLSCCQQFIQNGKGQLAYDYLTEIPSIQRFDIIWMFMNPGEKNIFNDIIIDLEKMKKISENQIKDLNRNYR